MYGGFFVLVWVNLTHTTFYFASCHLGTRLCSYFPASVSLLYTESKSLNLSRDKTSPQQVGSESIAFIPPHYTLLTFLRFEQHIFAEFTNCLHMLPLISQELFYRLSQKFLKIKSLSEWQTAKSSKRQPSIFHCHIFSKNTTSYFLLSQNFENNRKVFNAIKQQATRTCKIRHVL